MADVEFQDYSFEVKSKINSITIAKLNKWAAEIASRAKMGCTMEDDAGVQLRKSYSFHVDEGKGVATVGSPLESAFWEEFGTGSHADKSKSSHPSRQGWWVYYKNNPNPRSDTTHYATREEAEAVAKRLRAIGKDAYATNGRDPSYTLEKAFKSAKPLVIADFESDLRGVSSK